MMPHNVDIHVGRMMRQRRWLVGMTQQQLAETVGIKFQQIQKYETGANRVSASRLWDIAGALGVPMTHFFDGIEHVAPPEAVINSEQAPADFLNNKGVMDLVRLYYAIPKDLRRRVIDLARVLGGAA